MSVPNNSNLVLGRGQVFFDQFPTGTKTKVGEQYLGSSASFNLTVATQDLMHYSMEGGVKTKDRSVTLQADFSGTLTIENMNDDNLARFFLGESETATIAAATAATEDFVVVPGFIYQIGMSEAKPEGLENVTVTSVTLDPTGANTALVADTDYRVDGAAGYIQILESGAATSGATIRVTYDSAAQTQNRVISGNTQIEGAMRFRSANPVGGQRNFYMPEVVLRPNGDLALKGDEWMNIAFNLDVIQAGNLQALYASQRGTV